MRNIETAKLVFLHELIAMVRGGLTPRAALDAACAELSMTDYCALCDALGGESVLERRLEMQHDDE